MSASDFLFICVGLWFLMWSGILPAIGLAVVGALIFALEVIDHVWTKLKRRLPGYEERQIKKLMEIHKRRFPSASVQELINYEARLRKTRGRS